MAHIDTDQHCPLRVKRLWELKVVQVAARFRVDLSEDVGSFGQIKLKAVASSDDLGWYPVLQHYLFEGLVIILALEHTDDHRWMTELFVAHHVLPQLLIKLFLVVLFGKLDPMRLFNSELKLLRCFLEVFVNVVSDLVGAVVVLIDHDPLLVQQVDWL